MNDKNKAHIDSNERLTEFLLYKSPSGEIKIDVLIQNETIWLPQKKIALLFDVKIPAISKHINNIFDSGELQKEATVSILETVQNTYGKFTNPKQLYFKSKQHNFSVILLAEIIGGSPL